MYLGSMKPFSVSVIGSLGSDFFRPILEGGISMITTSPAFCRAMGTTIRKVGRLLMLLFTYCFLDERPPTLAKKTWRIVNLPPFYPPHPPIFRPYDQSIYLTIGFPLINKAGY